MSAPDVVIVDYGVGNVGSLANALAKMGKSAIISGDAETIAGADRLILPGVGSFDRAANRLRESGLFEPLLSAARAGTPLAGVCLGMQLLLDSSEEGVEQGLGLIPGTSTRFPDTVDDSRLLVPHMGWNTVTAAKKSAFLPSLGESDRYYFVHSYFVKPTDDNDVLSWSDYGHRFASAVERDNVVGIQFHPEKSHRFGLRLLADFASGK